MFAKNTSLKACLLELWGRPLVRIPILSESHAKNKRPSEFSWCLPRREDALPEDRVIRVACCAIRRVPLDGIRDAEVVERSYRLATRFLVVFCRHDQRPNKMVATFF